MKALFEFEWKLNNGLASNYKSWILATIVWHFVSVGDCVKILPLIISIETLMSASSDCNIGYFWRLGCHVHGMEQFESLSQYNTENDGKINICFDLDRQVSD